MCYCNKESLSGSYVHKRIIIQARSWDSVAVGGDVDFFLWFNAPTSLYSTSKDLKQNTAMGSQVIDFISPTSQGKIRNPSSRLEGEVTISVHRRGGSCFGSFHSWKAGAGQAPSWATLVPASWRQALRPLRSPRTTDDTWSKGMLPRSGPSLPKASYHRGKHIMAQNRTLPITVSRPFGLEVTSAQTSPFKGEQSQDPPSLSLQVPPVRLIIWDVHPEEVEKPWRAESIYLGLWLVCVLWVLTTEVQTKWYRTWIIIFINNKTYTGFYSLVWFRLCSKNEVGGNELCKENPQTPLCLWLW